MVTMLSYEEFHGIVVERIDKLTNLLNYMKTLNSDSVKLISEKDRVKELINPHKRIRKKHLNCLDNVAATDDKIQRVEEEMKLICLNTQGLIKIIDEVTGTTKERHNERTLQETSLLKPIIPQNLIMGLGNIGDSAAILPRDSVINFKYRNFQINCYDSNTENCRSSQFSHRTKRARVKSVGMDSTCASSSVYVPRSIAALGTISILGFSAEAPSGFWMGEHLSISVSDECFRGHEYFYGFGAICFTDSRNREDIGNGFVVGMGPTILGKGHYVVGSSKGSVSGMCIFPSKDIVGNGGGALLLCTDGIDTSSISFGDCFVGVSPLRINAGGGNNRITINDNTFSDGEIITRINGSGYKNLIFNDNKMCGRKLYFNIGESCNTKILFNDNNIGNGELHINIDGSGDTDVLFHNNDIRGGKLDIKMNGNGNINVLLYDNNIRGGEVGIMIGGTGNSKVLLNDNIICGGALYVKINGTGNTNVMFNNNDICGGTLRVKIDGTGNGDVIVKKQ